MIRLYNNPNRKPVIGYNDETGFTIAGKEPHMELDDVWAMWHEGTADLTTEARKQIKREVYDEAGI